MADNTPGPGGDTIATDELVTLNGGASSGVKVQRTKVGFGADGDFSDVSSAAPLPVAITGTTPINTNPDFNTPALPVAQRPVEIWTATFSDVGSALLSPKFTQLRLGAGVTVSQASGNLQVAAGTTTNAEFLARSTENFNGAFIQRLRATLSQRIVNNNFAVLLADNLGDTLAYTINSTTSITVTKTAHGFTAQNVGQFVCLGAITGAAGVPGRYAIASIPSADTINFTVAGWPASGTGTLSLFGWNYYRALYSGTVVTNVLVDAQRQGWASGDTTATINTTASPGHILQLAVDGRNAYWADSLAASAAAPNFTTRASRYENLPEPDIQLFVYLWSFNGTTAPASSTTLTIGFVSIEDTVNNPVYIAGARSTGQAAPLPVAFPSAQSVTFPSAQAVSLSTLPALAVGTNQIGAVLARSDLPSIIVDVGSAALTSTTTTAAVTPTFGSEYEVNVPVTAVSGTSPTLDIVIQESDDSGTNWFDVWHMERITATGIYRSPKLVLKGNRVRYVQTVGGTTPSFTRAVNRLQGNAATVPIRRRLLDRALNVNSGTPNTAALNVAECSNAQLIVNMGAVTTTAPAIKLQMSEDNVTWMDVAGGSVTTAANSTVQVTVANVQAQFLRAIVSTTGSGATLGFVAVKGW